MSIKHQEHPSKADLLRVVLKQQRAYVRECGVHEYNQIVYLVESGAIATWDELAAYGISR